MSKKKLNHNVEVYDILEDVKGSPINGGTINKDTCDKDKDEALVRMRQKVKNSYRRDHNKNETNQ